MPALPSSNTEESVDREIERAFEDVPGEITYGTAQVKQPSLTEPMSGSQTTPATQRIGVLSDRTTETPRTGFEKNGTGGVKIKGVTLLGEGRRIADYDSHREGKNVKNMLHFDLFDIDRYCLEVLPDII